MTLLLGANDHRNQQTQTTSVTGSTKLVSESAKVVGNLAIFDLDHTLLGGDSNMIWTDYLYERGLVDDAFMSLRDKFFADYKAGSLDFSAYMAHMFAPFARFDYQTLCRYRDDCFKTQVAPKLYPQGRELVEAHRKAGDTLLIISATNEFLIEPVCRALGVSEIIGVQLERVNFDNTDNANNANSNFTGKHIGTPSFGAGKQIRLEQWLDNQGRKLSDYGHSYFYSDSINDAPLLETVTDAITVNPDDKLKALAQTRGWQVLSFE